MEDSIRRLQEMVDESSRIVFFGGAGVSTESGIPDFRSVDGLYNQKYAYPPETILSHTFFVRNTKEFYRFYRDKMLCLSAQPNAAHQKLAEMEAKGKLTAVITQNIDGLHQMAGSRCVLELHGSVHRNYCQRCGKNYDARYMYSHIGHAADSTAHRDAAEVARDDAVAEVPLCDCGGVIKPDVVLYEEGLDTKTIQDAIYHISHADLLIIAGTSLAVYPAAGLIDYFRGNHLVVINKSPTPRDRQADLLIPDSIGAVLRAVEV